MNHHDTLDLLATEGSCNGTDTAWFFAPGGNEKHSSTYFRAAKNICDGCPVLPTCRDYSLKHEELGFWAGMSENKRRIERRRLGIVPNYVIYTLEATR